MATWYIGYDEPEWDVPSRHHLPYWIKCGKHGEGYAYDTLDECFDHYFTESDHEPVVTDECLGDYAAYDYLERKNSPTVYVCGRGSMPLCKLSDPKQLQE